jgi:hypothetical protein
VQKAKNELAGVLGEGTEVRLNGPVSPLVRRNCEAYVVRSNMAHLVTPVPAYYGVLNTLAKQWN